MHLEPDGSRPRPLPDGFDAVYGPSAGGRRVRARLHHPAAPPPGAPARPWRFRGADLDPAGHVNNAVYWAALEEELVADEPAGGLAAEVEHRAAAGTGEGAVLHARPDALDHRRGRRRGGDVQAGSLTREAPRAGRPSPRATAGIAMP